MNKFANAYNFVYGILITIGGLIGYLTAGSIKSLVAGGLSGLFIIILNYWNNVWRHFYLTLISIGLLTLFILRLLSTGKAMPALIIILLSFVALLVNLYIFHSFRTGK